MISILLALCPGVHVLMALSISAADGTARDGLVAG